MPTTAYFQPITLAADANPSSGSDTDPRLVLLLLTKMSLNLDLCDRQARLEAEEAAKELTQQQRAQAAAKQAAKRKRHDAQHGTHSFDDNDEEEEEEAPPVDSAIVNF